jgi:hypothetical protein
VEVVVRVEVVVVRAEVEASLAEDIQIFLLLLRQ